MIEKSERHAAFDAPNTDEFERLYAATFERGDDYETRLEDRFIIVGGGRLTLRRGELLHLNNSWLGRERTLIKIPRFEDCDCPYCHDRAENYAEDRDMTVTKAMEYTWSPKTVAGVRAVYYGWSGYTIEAVEQFVDVVGELDICASTINRRVDALADYAGVEDLYPHALRAASAFFWSDIGLEAAYLQAIMGWNSIEVAVAYLRASGTQLAQRIERAFAVGGLERPDPVPAEDVLPPNDDAVAESQTQRPSPRSSKSLWDYAEASS